MGVMLTLCEIVLGLRVEALITGDKLSDATGKVYAPSCWLEKRETVSIIKVSNACSL